MPGCAHGKGAGAHIEGRKVMFELFNFNPLQTAPPQQYHTDHGGAERAPKERKVSQRSSSHWQGRLMPTHSLPPPGPCNGQEANRRDPLLYLLASGGQRSLPAPCCIKPCKHQQLSSTQNSSWSWLSACRGSRAPNIPGRLGKHLTAAGLTS